MTEIIFEVIKSDDGGYEARARGHSIFSQGEDWNELQQMVREAVLCHFDQNETPRVIKLHQVRDEVIAI